MDGPERLGVACTWRAIRWRWLAACAALALLGGCDAGEPPAAPAARGGCAAGPGLPRVPPGFCVELLAADNGPLRHLVAPRPRQVFAARRHSRLGIGGVLELADGDGDGLLEPARVIGDAPAYGLGVHGGFLYVGTDAAVVRYRLPLAATAQPEVVVDGFAVSRGYHAAKALAFDDAGGLYVNIGAPSNACQRVDREPGIPGQDPCPELERAGGIWRYAADRPGQDAYRDGTRVASGLRHVVAMDWHPVSRRLFVVQHGRDDLHRLWPRRFTVFDDQRLPAEELHAIETGRVYGWPYCYYDGVSRAWRLAPEYGGDGHRAGRCTGIPAPLVALPAHAGPNDMLFYLAEQFPRRWRGGAFIALHGAWRDADGHRHGHQVAFVPFDDGWPSGGWEVFADGFAGADPEHPAHRPTGLAVDPSGALLVSDSLSGHVWRIRWVGDGDGPEG